MLANDTTKTEIKKWMAPFTLFVRTFANLANMMGTGTKAGRMMDFVERVVPVHARAYFDQLPGNVRKLIERVYDARIASGALSGRGNFAGALVEVKTASGGWRPIRTPRTAQSVQEFQHSEEVLEKIER